MLSLKCKLLISLPELQNVAAFPFSYISLMLSTLTQVSELPSVPTLLPETSSSILSPQWSCPLKGRLQYRDSAKFMLCSGIYLEQLQNSQSAAPASLEAGILWEDLSSACPQCTRSTSNKVTTYNVGVQNFHFFLSVTLSTHLNSYSLCLKYATALIYF